MDEQRTDGPLGSRDLSVLGGAADAVQNISKAQSKCTSTIIDSTTTQQEDESQVDPADSSRETSEEKVLRLDETFKNIINSLKLPDLKTARLVASRWRDTAFSEVVRHSVVRLKYNQEEQQYVQLKRCDGSDPAACSSEQMNRSLGDLLECLRHSSNFPVSNFGFIGGNMGTANANKFFRDHGGRVKTLLFDVGTNIYNIVIPGHKSTWRRNLIYNAPLIEHMEMDYLVPALEELHIVLPFDFFSFRQSPRYFGALHKESKISTAFGVSLKIKPPLCDPSILRLVKVTVVRKTAEQTNGTSSTSYSSSFNFVSWITDIYHLMPNIKVILTYDQGDALMVNALRSLPSFITIE